MKIGEVIKSYRKRNKITQEMFSELAGISRNYLSQIERGQADNLSLDVYTKINRAMKVDESKERDRYKSLQERTKELENLTAVQLIAIIVGLWQENYKLEQRVTTRYQDILTFRTLWELEKKDHRETISELERLKELCDSVEN